MWDRGMSLLNVHDVRIEVSGIPYVDGDSPLPIKCLSSVICLGSRNITHYNTGNRLMSSRTEM
jgi:hypothetical protein